VADVLFKPPLAEFVEKRRARCKRSEAYDRQSSIGRFDKGLDEAQSRGWTIVDTKQDWKVIFPPKSN
jgi:hypothetical protein